VSGATGVIDLGRLALEHGQGRRLDVELAPTPIRLGDQTYEAAGSPIPGRIELSRTSGGWALRLSFSVKIEGACVRCLEPASLELEIDAREVDEQSADDEELRSPYVDGLEVDVAHWADDALALAMPQQPLCRDDCAGLCPVCGVSLNDADPADHDHAPSRDPRWAKLDDLKLD
jgi:uncharacterized protein